MYPRNGKRKKEEGILGQYAFFKDALKSFDSL